MLVTTYNNNNDEVRVYLTDESQWDTETPFSVCSTLRKKFEGKGEWIAFAWWRGDVEWMAVDKVSNGKGSKAYSEFEAVLLKHKEAAKTKISIKI